jgi:hypothetical protein
MTGLELGDSADGIWEDGEWISWDYINRQLYERERGAEFPAASPELLDLFDDLVQIAADYKRVTGRYLPLFGELGELYAEIKFGIKRHRPMAQGSDGKLGNDFVEVKTISPEKRRDEVKVSGAGNFSKLVVVRITADFEFEARIINRRALKIRAKPHAVIAWNSLPE